MLELRLFTFKSDPQGTEDDEMAALSTATKRLGRLLPQSSVLFVCDVQEVFRGLTFQLPTVVHGTNTMVR